ncbi:MAG: 50S ribosomal protein L20 [Candidatus Latescibacterota bacterium]|nr:MAG: 50S ribosomal protein L20 [Candidatus Latescibacterota bacterium]
MSRVKTGTTRHARHKKVLKLTRGYRMSKNRLYKVAHEAMMHAGEYAFHGRKRRKRNFRTLWITRINAALRILDSDYSYSRFIADLNTAKITLNRKSLSEIAIADPIAFETIVGIAHPSK